MSTTTENSSDRFGNRLDPRLRYARGLILADDVAEARRQQSAYALVRERFGRLGDAGIFNLTGLIRGFPFEPDDADALRSYVHFIARSDRELERLAVPLMGGNWAEHDGFLATRVSAAMLAIMLTVLQPADEVVSLVAADRSHPSIRGAVDIARGTFSEVTDIAAFRELLAIKRPRLVVISAISPSKHHLPLEVTREAIAAAHMAGSLVMLDDAHMSARIGVYDEPPALALGADLSVWSLDKHVGGPRCGFVVARREVATAIKVRAFSLGIEAQLGQYIAGLNAVRHWDLQPIKQAASLAQAALAELQPSMPQVYPAGAGIAMSGEDLLTLALAKVGVNNSDIVPIEAVAYAALDLLNRTGAVTIPAVGVPGAACALRLMLYPDGAQYGLPAIVAAMRDAVDVVAEGLRHPAMVRETLLGAD